jgi:hypothetical protein
MVEEITRGSVSIACTGWIVAVPGSDYAHRFFRPRGRSGLNYLYMSTCALNMFCEIWLFARVFNAEHSNKKQHGRRWGTCGVVGRRRRLEARPQTGW